MKSIFTIISIISVFSFTSISAQQASGMKMAKDTTSATRTNDSMSQTKIYVLDTTKNQVHDLPDADDAPSSSKRKHKFNFTSPAIPATGGTSGSNTAPGK